MHHENEIAIQIKSFKINISISMIPVLIVSLGAWHGQNCAERVWGLKIRDLMIFEADTCRQALGIFKLIRREFLSMNRSFSWVEI